MVVLSYPDGVFIHPPKEHTRAGWSTGKSVSYPSLSRDKRAAWGLLASLWGCLISGNNYLLGGDKVERTAGCRGVVPVQRGLPAQPGWFTDLVVLEALYCNARLVPTDRPWAPLRPTSTQGTIKLQRRATSYNLLQRAPWAQSPWRTSPALGDTSSKAPHQWRLMITLHTYYRYRHKSTLCRGN